jgi:photosystem II stability/assembly factor-like uncharacterized protein
MKYIRILFLLLIMSAMAHLPTIAQDGNSMEETLKDAVKYRFLGPYRGGRATTAIGIKEKPFTFFMGTTGGGVWKTDDAGNTWDNISDGQIKCGSIGSIAIHPKYSDVMYVGTGSDSPRGNISAGIGIYKSVDGGKTWNHAGLDKTGQIGDIVFHPDNPDVAYVAALGNIFGPNKERGVYKTTDGGKSWKHSFYLSDTVGALDLALHPNNPDVLYAGMWRAERKPWTMIDGGMDGGLFKTIDGGSTWNKVHNGLPKGLIGRIGVDISPVDPDIIYVIQQTFEEKDGGVYKSTDGGKNFKRINGDHNLRQRGWYYSRIFADPADKNTVYVTNTGFYRSIDGGKNFDQRLRVPHGDCHSVWINPNDPDIIINTNDGGATITLNGGKTWSTQNNQPTSELYRISTDNQFPFRVYAGQQDNTTISVPVRNRGGLDPKQHWLEVGGGESGDVAVSPANSDIVYATTYSGIITRVDLESGERRYVGAYPHYTEGTEQRNLKYRWQWNFPIRISQHNNNVIYHTSNYVHKSTDEGTSWQIISPDLTRNIKAYQDIPGGPIQHDATGVEVYSSIFSMAESPFDPQELWVGSDDGLVHVSKDGGLNWKDVTPKILPEEATINHIELSKHNRNHIFIVAYNYRYADFKPYICVSKDGGKTWLMKVNGIAADHFVRAMAQDSEDPEILYAGTEYGMYISKNEGTTWEPLQLNLPHTPITDMEVKGNALVMSTQGRGFWTIDDISIIRAMKERNNSNPLSIVQVPDTYISNLGRSRGAFSPEGSPYEVDMYIWSPDSTADNTIYFMDAKGDTCHMMEKQTIKKGLNKISWDMSTAPPKMVSDLVMMDMRYPGEGPSIPPGSYEVMIKDGDKELKTKFAVKVDPSWKTPAEDFQETYALAKEIAEAIENSQKSIMHLRKVADASNELKEREQLKAMKSDLEDLSKKAKEIQDIIYQDKILASQDEINFERKFTNHIIRLYRVVLGQHGKPTAGERERWEDLKKTYTDFQEAYKDFKENTIMPMNEQLKTMDLPYIPQDYGK